MTEATTETREHRAGRARYAVREPEEMTPDERFREIAAILARGALRMRVREAAAESSEN
ncbi:MAG: hypothetical protein R6V58_04495 [Planctomycetota bacterium]